MYGRVGACPERGRRDPPGPSQTPLGSRFTLEQSLRGQDALGTAGATPALPRSASQVAESCTHPLESNSSNKVWRPMKAAIHPAYNEIRVMCACGSSFTTRSTHKGDIHVEICSACHPFFTGKQKLMDTAGRVERFRRKYAKAEPAKK